MLCYTEDVRDMERLTAKGQSGRVVIEIDPMVKGRLYELLSLRGVTLNRLLKYFPDRVKELGFEAL